MRPEDGGSTKCSGSDGNVYRKDMRSSCRVYGNLTGLCTDRTCDQSAGVAANWYE